MISFVQIQMGSRKKEQVVWHFSSRYTIQFFVALKKNYLSTISLSFLWMEPVSQRVNFCLQHVMSNSISNW